MPLAPVLHLRLASSDLWRRHGGVNVIMTLMSVLFIPWLVALGASGSRISAASPQVWLFVAWLVLFVLLQQSVLRSALAIVSTRPYVTFSDVCVAVDGGIFDRWVCNWNDVSAMAPQPELLGRCLTDGGFCVLTLRLKVSRRRRWFSNVQHLRHHDHLQISGYFAPLSATDVRAVIQLLKARVSLLEPSLLSDS